jgi:integrase
MVSINTKGQTKIKGLVLVKGIPYFQKAVPSELQQRLGKTIIRASLDRARALHQQCQQLNNRYTALFTAMRSDDALVPSEAKLAALAILNQAQIEVVDSVEIQYTRDDGLIETLNPAVDHLDDYLRDRGFTPNAATAMAFKLLNAGDMPVLLSEAFDIYLENHSKGRDADFIADTKKHWDKLISLLGDISVESLNRAHAKRYRDSRLSDGVKTTTVSREIAVIKAVINKAIRELSLRASNPFEALVIHGKGEDSIRRQPLSLKQIEALVHHGIDANDSYGHLTVVLALTGMRLAEALGLRTSDIDFDKGMIWVKPHSLRPLKTKPSERGIPMLEPVRDALQKALKHCRGSGVDALVFQQLWGKDGSIRVVSNRVSATVKNRVAKVNKDASNLDLRSASAHSLRHTLRDALRATECPESIAKAIGGWGTGGDISTGYGKGYSREVLLKWLSKGYAPVLKSFKS